MELTSTCIDRVLRDLKLLSERCPSGEPAHAIRGMKFLHGFLMCARKLSHSNYMYLESDNVVKQVSLPSLLSCIADTLHNCFEAAEDSHSVSLRSETIWKPLTVELKYQIQSFKEEIIQVYFTLASSRSLQSNSCMRDDELIEFIDHILQNLKDLTIEYLLLSMAFPAAKPIFAILSAQVQSLEVKLTFLKSFISFAKLPGTVDIPPLLLDHFEMVALNAARLSYMCYSLDHPIEAIEGYTPEFCSMICEQQQKIKPVDFQVYEIYMEVLRAIRSSKSLDSPMMDKQIVNNFNDSLISCLWELLSSSSSFTDSMKDDMQILYAGLRFLRSILKQHQEKMDDQNKRIGALIGEAGIIICSPSLNRSEALDCCDMLSTTNRHIKEFKDQICGSSIIESS